MMNRREAVARLVALTGIAVVGGEALLTGCRPAKRTWAAFTPSEVALMDEIGETILPATDTPGAKAAGIGAFMAMMVNDCYDDASHAAFADGLAAIESLSQRRHGKSFVAISPAERTSLLEVVQSEQAQYKRKPGEPVHYLAIMKELTIIGYFTSEIGSTRALRYVEAPGSYDGNVPYRKGDRAWFVPTHRFG